MKHLEHTFETYVYSHCNMYNIPIYFRNIDIKHLQHTSETSETLNIRLQHALSAQCHLDAWTNGGSLLRSSTRVQRSAAARSSPMRQRRGQLAGGVASHEAPPLSCLLKNPSWRLTGLVERPRRADVMVQVGGVMEAEWERRAVQWRQST
jgi:hypothetical protein